MSRSDLWGVTGDLDYWTALAREEVDGPEKKAVDLLRRVVDPDRFHLYCQTGQLPIMGNVTRRMYYALKSGGCLEMEDGVQVAWWCFSVGPYAPDIPDTDQVLSVRMIVEGEELSMFTTGDRHPRGYHLDKQKTKRRLGVVDPFVGEFVGRGERRPDIALKTEELLDLGNLYPIEAGQGLMGGIGYVQAQGVGQYVNAGAAGGQNILYDAGFGNDQNGPDDGYQLWKKPAQPVPLHEQRLAREERANSEAMGFPAEDRGDSNDLYGDLRARVAQGVNQEMARAGQDVIPWPAQDHAFRAPWLPGAEYGIDMHDGTRLIVDPEWAQRMFVERGIQVFAEVQRMQDEGYSPEIVEAGVNALDPNHAWAL